MTNKPNSLKNIFQKHFFPFWKSNSSKFPKEIHSDILDNIGKFLNCGDISQGYTALYCKKCNHIHTIPFSCKSRFCSSCGKTYAENWALKLQDSLINTTHIHAVFSLPTGFIRDFFFKHRFKLADLATAAYKALKYAFKKVGIYSFGTVINIHTFSRDLNWNPHIHALITLGGFNKSNYWKTIKNLPWLPLKKSWQKLTLDIIYKVAKANNNTYLKNNISLVYRKYPKGFYVNADSKVNNSFELGKYLGRYLARPAIAEYRITKVTDSSVTFWFEKPDSNFKEEITLPISQFIGRLISHIPPKHFKMIRRFGLYARHTKIKYPRR